MCINYAPINNVTVDFTYPINDCLSIIANFGEATVFTGLDIKAGFHNIPMSNGDE